MECINTLGFYNDEITKTKSRKMNNYEIREINTVEIQVTNRCNLDCSYCFQKHKTPDTLTEFDYYRIFDLLFNDEKDTEKFEKFKLVEGDRGYFLLYIIGGEPLLEISNIRKALKYFESKLKAHNMESLKWKISFTTNGTLYFKEEVQSLLDEYGDKVWIITSVDGYTAESHDKCRKFQNGKGSFDIVSKALSDFDKRSENKYTAKMKYVISKNNLHDMEKDVYEFIKAGYHYVHSGLVVEDSWTIEDAREYYLHLIHIADYIIDNKLYNSFDLNLISRYKALNEFTNESVHNIQKRCAIFSTRKISFAANTNIIACFALDQSSVGDKEMKYGNIYTGECTTQEEKDIYEYLYGGFQIHEYLTYKCLYCPAFVRCSGCPALSYAELGRFELNTNACEMYTAEYLANLYYILRLRLLGAIKDDYLLKYKNLMPRDRCIPIIGEEEYNLLTELSRRSLIYGCS